MNNLVPAGNEVCIDRFVCGKGITLFGEGSIVGRSVVIHEHSDDLGLQGIPFYSNDNPHIPQSVLYYKDMSESELRNVITSRSLTKDPSIVYGDRKRLIRFLEEGSKKTGNAGGRMACGIIGHAK